jgi:hypothetical protein
VTSTATAPDGAILTRADRCDRCGARATVRAVFPNGEDLLFCAHHARHYGTELGKAGAILTA